MSIVISTTIVGSVGVNNPYAVTVSFGVPENTIVKFSPIKILAGMVTVLLYTGVDTTIEPLVFTPESNEKAIANVSAITGVKICLIVCGLVVTVSPNVNVVPEVAPALPVTVITHFCNTALVASIVTVTGLPAATVVGFIVNAPNVAGTVVLLLTVVVLLTTGLAHLAVHCADTLDVNGDPVIGSVKLSVLVFNKGGITVHTTVDPLATVFVPDGTCTNVVVIVIIVPLSPLPP